MGLPFSEGFVGSILETRLSSQVVTSEWESLQSRRSLPAHEEGGLDGLRNLPVLEYSTKRTGFWSLPETEGTKRIRPKPFPCCTDVIIGLIRSIIEIPKYFVSARKIKMHFPFEKKPTFGPNREWRRTVKLTEKPLGVQRHSKKKTVNIIKNNTAIWSRCFLDLVKVHVLLPREFLSKCVLLNRNLLSWNFIPVTP